MKYVETMVLVPGECEGGCKPDKDPWTPEGGSKVRIKNSSGSKQILSNIKNSCLKTKNGKRKYKITLDDGEIWKGRAGKKGKKGCYEYDDGCKEAAPRNGQIDPS